MDVVGILPVDAEGKTPSLHEGRTQKAQDNLLVLSSWPTQHVKQIHPFVSLPSR